MKYLLRLNSCLFLLFFIIFSPFSCSKVNNNQLKQQIINAHDQCILYLHEFFNYNANFCKIEYPTKKDINKLKEEWEKLQSSLSSMGRTRDSLETSLGLPILQGKNWYDYLYVTKVIEDMQEDYLNRIAAALDVSISEYIRIVSINQIQYIIVYLPAVNKRQECIKKLGLNSSLLNKSLSM